MLIRYLKEKHTRATVAFLRVTTAEIAATDDRLSRSLKGFGPTGIVALLAIS
jgi:hypothetical protein